MYKDEAVYLRDMLRAAEKVRRYTRGLSLEGFLDNEMAIDAVLRNLEIIGEAAKKVSAPTRRLAPGIEWRKIAGLRDILIHDYANVSMEIVWDIVQNKILDLRKQLRVALAGMKE